MDLSREQIRIVTQKTSKRLVIPITPRLKTHLEGLTPPVKTNTPVHPKAFATVARQGKTANLSNQFADLLAAAGLREKKAHRKIGDGVGRGVGSSSAGLQFPLFTTHRSHTEEGCRGA